MKAIRIASLSLVAACLAFCLSACSVVEDSVNEALEGAALDIAVDLENAASDVAGAFDSIASLEEVPAALGELFGAAGTSLDKLTHVEVTDLQTGKTIDVADHKLILTVFSGIDPSQWTYTPNNLGSSSEEYEFVIYQNETVKLDESKSKGESAVMTIVTYTDSSIVHVEIADLPIAVDMELPQSDIDMLRSLAE